MEPPRYIVSATPPEDLTALCGVGPLRYPPESAETVCALVEALRACGYEVVVELEAAAGRTISAGNGQDVADGRVPRLTPELLLAAVGSRAARGRCQETVFCREELMESGDR